MHFADQSGNDVRTARVKVIFRPVQIYRQQIDAIEIVLLTTPSERAEISPLIRKKPTRTISGVAIVAVMCKPHKCPHGRCTYCPESDIAPPSYTGEEPAALEHGCII